MSAKADLGRFVGVYEFSYHFLQFLSNELTNQVSYQLQKEQ